MFPEEKEKNYSRIMPHKGSTANAKSLLVISNTS